MGGGRKYFLFVDYFLWLFLYFMYRFWVWMIPWKRDYKKMRAKEEGKINKEEVPTFVPHITDLHMVRTQPEEEEHIAKLFDILVEKFKPEYVFVTGDMVDGRKDASKFSEYGQYEINWKSMNAIFEKHSKIKFITVAGNHDDIRCNELGGEDHLFVKFCRGGNPDNYVTQTFTLNTSRGKVRIVAFNQSTFPFPPNPLGIFTDIPEESLDKLDAILKEDDGSYFTIMVTHYPVDAIVNSRHYEEVVKKERKIRFQIVGHYHCDYPFYHYVSDGIVECIGTVPENGSGYIQVVSIDNGISVVTPVDLLGPFDYFAITNPPPANQFSPENYYVGNDFRIRVAVWSKEPKKITAYVDGIKVGEMEKDCETDACIIYGIDAHAENGKHPLKLEGDVEKIMEFFVGPENEPVKSYGMGYYMRVWPMAICALFFNFMMIALSIGPFFLNWIPATAKLMQNYHNWMWNNGQISNSAVADWFIAFFAGPLYFMWRFNFCSTRMQLNVLIVHFMHYLIPFFFYYGKTVFAVFFWGTITKHRIYFDLSAMMSESIHIMGMSYPYYFIASAVGNGSDKSIPIYCLVTFGLLALIGALWGIWVMASMAGGLLSFFTSPTLMKWIIHGGILIADLVVAFS